MQHKHLIMGTAGHVDHGKTSLIRAITGFDCDTHKEEKKRGITINLGFTHLDLDKDTSIGIVDVPGHSDFINTMISGACGIDFAVLLIAADEGIMPQTREHLSIMELLGIEHGLIVLTKKDLVDEELLELAEEEVREFAEDSFLKDAPVISVSAISKEGIPELLQEIKKITHKISPKNSEGFFRMYIDRIFTVQGFGTVVNGSVLSGKAETDKRLFLQPGNKEVRIRKIEHHGKAAKTVTAGDRAAFNLTGLRQKDFKRGMILSDKIIKETNLLDVKIKLFPTGVNLKLWSNVIFLTGTYKAMVKVHLLDADQLSSGDTCLAQVYLPEPLSAIAEDRFIIRNTSGDITLGGGIIIDTEPLHHRRRRKKHIEDIQKTAEGSFIDRIAVEVKKTIYPLSLNQIAEKLHESIDKIEEEIAEKLPKEIALLINSDQKYLMQKDRRHKILDSIIKTLKKHHAENPLDAEGKTSKELFALFGSKRNADSDNAVSIILDEMLAKGQIKKAGKTLALSGHKISITPQLQKALDYTENKLNEAKPEFAFNDDWLDDCLDLGITEKEYEKIAQSSKKSGKIINFRQQFIGKPLVDKVKRLLIDFYQKNPDEGIALAEVRDRLNGSRKIISFILEYFDIEGFTVRKDNFRFPTQKMKNEIEKQGDDRKC
ncbi:MAG: selenocysteine-specific translation elongation factor [Candidatus Cloacimonadota bacterium]|nr:MAG: selenocysteine-specific translation elongation factor [Candidatus Cloacimonadota bacterium]